VTRPVRLFIAASLDGYIAGPAGEIDWLFHDQDYGITPFTESVDTVLMGRKSYEALLGFDPWPYPTLAAWVFTHRPRAYDDARVTFTDRAPADVVAEVRAAPGKDIWLFGGGELVRAFMDARLIDDYVIAVHPVVLGSGLPLFPAGTRRTALTFVDATTYDTGLAILTYRRAHDG